jgi:hypothetical protein
MPELIIQTVSLEYLVKFFSDRRKDAVVQHLTYRPFKTHAENVFRINIFKMFLRLVCHFDQMLPVVVIIFSVLRIVTRVLLSVEVNINVLP